MKCIITWRENFRDRILQKRREATRVLGDCLDAPGLAEDGNPQGVAEMNFEGGLVIARFRIAADGEPRLITMFPIGRRQ